MNTTTASGSSLATCLADSLPQSSRSVFEIPVPTCTSRTVLTPSPASRRASSASSGWASESPVTRTVFSSRGRSAFAPSSTGSNSEGDTGPPAAARPPPAGVAASAKPPPPSRSSSGESQASASPAADSSGSRSASQPVGLPTASTTSRWNPGSISSPALRTEPPASRIRMSRAPTTTSTESRAGRRRPRGASGTLSWGSRAI